jgi:hypothetical protein
MIMIINKLIALLPNPRQEVFHTWRMACRGIDPVPMWIVPDWFGRLAGRHRQLTAAAFDRMPHFDAAGPFINPCSNCGREAINVRGGQLGTWYCGMCKSPPSP